MATSQKSFVSILGKFSDGVAVIKTIPQYNPAKPAIKIDALDALLLNVQEKNNACINTSDNLKTLRNQRIAISFKTKESDVNCLENLFNNILSYIKVDFGADHPAAVLIASILKTLHPVYEKKEAPADGSEPKKSKSESERSYQALAGYGLEIHASISGIGTDYQPQNTAITPANFKAKVDQLLELNTNVALAEKDYSDAVAAREEAYYGETGITSLITTIKNYLASFEGGKKNAGYIAFSYAVK